MVGQKGAMGQLAAAKPAAGPPPRHESEPGERRNCTSVVVRRSTQRAKAGMVQRTIVTGHEFGISAKRK